MNDFQRELKYLRDRISRAVSTEECNEIKRFVNWFFDKWSLEMNPTDPEWIKIKNELKENLEKRYSHFSRKFI